MMPGITYWPPASMMVAPCGSMHLLADFGDLAVLHHDGAFEVPLVTVMTVAF